MRKVLNILALLLIGVLCSCSDVEKENGTMEDVPSIIEKNEINHLSYSEKLSTFIEKEYVTNENFYNYITTDKEYIDNDEIAANALYVSPTGSGSGETVDNPCSIYDAVKNVIAGQTIYLRGGNYDLTGTVYISQSGTKDNYITIRNYPGEHVYISSSQEKYRPFF